MKSNLFLPFIRNFKAMDALPDPEQCSICHGVATRKAWTKATGLVGFCTQHLPEATEAMRSAMRLK